MRARGLLAELRVDDLRFTPGEASQLVTAVADVTPAIAEELAGRTEGWPAGLQLAALTLRASADPESTSASIRGDQRHILDYFVSEVLTDLDDDQRDLLVRCSVFDRLSGPLCDAVLETSDPQRFWTGWIGPIYSSRRRGKGGIAVTGCSVTCYDENWTQLLEQLWPTLPSGC